MNKEIITVNGIDFKYSQKNDGYGKVINVEDKNVLVCTYDLDNVEIVLEKAAKYINELNITDLKEFIANEYYEEDSIEINNISREEFISSIYLKIISVNLSGVDYWFDDNNIYGGHDILVFKDHDEDRYNITLAG